MSLTPKQKAFADYYIQTGNATESARKAGYKQPHVQGSQNLEKLRVQEYIIERNKVIENERIADMKEVKEFWTYMLRNETSEDKDRLKASEYIAKTNGAFLDKIELTSLNEEKSKLDGIITQLRGG